MQPKKFFTVLYDSYDNPRKTNKRDPESAKDIERMGERDLGIADRMLRVPVWKYFMVPVLPLAVDFGITVPAMHCMSIRGTKEGASLAKETLTTSRRMHEPCAIRQLTAARPWWEQKLPRPKRGSG